MRTTADPPLGLAPIQGVVVALVAGTLALVAVRRRWRQHRQPL